MTSLLSILLPHNLFKEKLTKLMEHTSNCIWLVMRNMDFFLLLTNLKDVNCGHVRKFVTLSFIFRTLYLLALVQNCIDNS